MRQDSLRSLLCSITFSHHVQELRSSLWENQLPTFCLLLSSALTSHQGSIDHFVLVVTMVVKRQGNRKSPSDPACTHLCWKKVSSALQTVYLSWMVSRCSSCWPNVRPCTLMLGGRISATHCRELRAGDLDSGG